MTAKTTTQTWKNVLANEKAEPYFQQILAFIEQELASGKTIYPQKSHIFNAFKLTPYKAVKVVIIGQDPYHGPRQAHGLCFSVQKGITAPPSLHNIFKELQHDCGIKTPQHGCLEAWARQGVLLLNTVLTVEAGKPGSHAKIGWQRFTDKVIQSLNQHAQPLVFLLWGSYAQQKTQLIDTQQHYVLKASHPSPFSAHRGFLGCQHFSKTNQILANLGRTPIDWQLD